MAIELITGKAGAPHIDSADVGACNAYTMGEGVYILHGLNAVLQSANSVSVAAGVLLAEGRFSIVSGSGEPLTIENGQSGYRRNDIIAAHYSKDDSGIEDVELVVVKGTPTSGTPSDPTMPNPGKVLEHATEAYWPLYRVHVDGLAPQTPVALAEPNPTALVQRLIDAPREFQRHLGIRTGRTGNVNLPQNAYSGVTVTFDVPFEDNDYDLLVVQDGSYEWAKIHFIYNDRRLNMFYVSAYSEAAVTDARFSYIAIHR